MLPETTYMKEWKNHKKMALNKVIKNEQYKWSLWYSSNCAQK